MSTVIFLTRILIVICQISLPYGIMFCIRLLKILIFFALLLVLFYTTMQCAGHSLTTCYDCVNTFKRVPS